MYEARVFAEFSGRQMRNNLRLVVRSPLRASMWVFSAIAAIGFIALRFATLRLSHYGHTSVPFDDRIAAIYTGAFLFYFAIPLLAPRAAGAQFANVAEALMIGSSKMPVRAIFVLLQLRALWRTLARMFIVLVIVATSGSAGPRTVAGITTLGFFVVLVPPAYAFHLNVASERVRKALRVLGAVMIAFAAALALGKIPHGGALMIAQIHGAWWPDATMFVLAAIGVCVPPSSDAIPELFAATKAGGVLAQRVANRRKRERSSDGGRLSDWVFDLPGEWVILSARLATFIRVRTPLVFAAGLLGWFALGIGIALGVGLLGSQSDEVVGAVAFPIGLIACILAASVGRDLGQEIRNPMWWAGDATLTARLGVDSIASLWRFAITLAAVFAGYGALGHVEPALYGLAGFTIAVWLARCCGYLLFAYFPAAADQRGALAGLRIFILFVLAVPVASVAIGVLFLHVAIVAQFALVALTAVAEALALIALSARRIDGRLEAYLQ